MKRKQCFAVLAAACLAFLSACSLSGGDFSYSNLDDGDYELVKYSGDEYEVISLPDSFGRGNVSKIATNWISDDSKDKVKKLVLPGHLTTISYNQFAGFTSLEEIELPTSKVTIAGYAFSNCGSLKSITITDGTIGEAAFENCKSLSMVVLPANLDSIPNLAFSGCESLKNIIIPETVTTLGSSSFANSGLVNVTIPGSIAFVGSEAFNYCYSLETLVMNEGVERIGLGAFRNNIRLSSVQLPKSLTTLEGMIFGNDKNLKSISYAGTMEEWDLITKADAWYSNSAIEKVVCSNGEITL